MAISDAQPPGYISGEKLVSSHREVKKEATLRQCRDDLGFGEVSASTGTIWPMRQAIVDPPPTLHPFSFVFGEPMLRLEFFSLIFILFYRRIYSNV